jgi:hypothetical protein
MFRASTGHHQGVSNTMGKYFTCVGFYVLTAVIMKTTIFRDITPCSTFRVNRRFGGTYNLHLQGRKISRARNQCEIRCKHLAPASLIVNMEATSYSETSVDFQRTARRYIPEDRTLQMISNPSFIYHQSLATGSTVK